MTAERREQKQLEWMASIFDTECGQERAR